MKRENSSTGGKKFPKKLRKQVWEKAAIVEGHPEEIWRKDKNGKIMNWQQYNSDDNGYGWAIVRIDDSIPDEPDNLEAISISSVKG